MQAMADVLDKPIGISSADMACAQGSAMYAAVARKTPESVILTEMAVEDHRVASR